MHHTRWKILRVWIHLLRLRRLLLLLLLLLRFIAAPVHCCSAGCLSLACCCWLRLAWQLWSALHVTIWHHMVHACGHHCGDIRQTTGCFQQLAEWAVDVMMQQLLMAAVVCNIPMT
jgi:hypothetical protein